MYFLVGNQSCNIHIRRAIAVGKIQDFTAHAFKQDAWHAGFTCFH
jgi:hypothetical protein